MEQFAIAFTGAVAIYLTQQSRVEWKRYACLFGLAGQPFWVYSAVANQQWGIAVLCLFYTYSWGLGAYNNWVKSGDK